MAFNMVAQYGMSERVGPMEYVSRWDHLSGQTRAMIEEEAQKTLTQAYERTRKLLLSKRKELDLLAKALVEYETLDRDEVTQVLAGKRLENRIRVPAGPMVVPKGPSPFEALPGLGGDGGGESPPPPPVPPQPPATAPSAEQEGGSS